MSYLPGFIDPFAQLRKNHYKVILADPPWRFAVRSPKGETKSPQAQYSCMDIATIQSMPVSDLAHPDYCVLVLWATAPMIQDALDSMRAWNFTYKTMAAWAKQSATGKKWAFGTGYIFRSAAEFILVGTRGSPQQKVRNVRNLLIAPVREHSRKPDAIYDIIESLWHGPYCELWARQQKHDWDVWGNETDKFVQATAGSTLSGLIQLDN